MFLAATVIVTITIRCRVGGRRRRAHSVAYHDGSGSRSRRVQLESLCPRSAALRD